MATRQVTIPNGTSIPEAIRLLNNAYGALNDKERGTAVVDAQTITITYTEAPKPKEAVVSAIALLDANPSGLTQQQITQLRASLAAINFPV